MWFSLQLILTLSKISLSCLNEYAFLLVPDPTISKKDCGKREFGSKSDFVRSRGGADGNGDFLSGGSGGTLGGGWVCKVGLAPIFGESLTVLVSAEGVLISDILTRKFEK